jgi:hypothetical protein
MVLVRTSALEVGNVGSPPSVNYLIGEFIILIT